MIQSVWKNLTGLQKAAEHLWCDFKCRPWAKNSSPNTNDLYIHYMDKSTGTPPSLEEKKTLPNCATKKFMYLKHFFSISVATVLKCSLRSVHNKEDNSYNIYKVLIAILILCE